MTFKRLTWNLEAGTWNSSAASPWKLELGTWKLELGTRWIKNKLSSSTLLVLDPARMLYIKLLDLVVDHPFGDAQ